VGAQGARRALPEQMQQSLRAAFASEVAARLPGLRAPLDDRPTALHHAHTLASSAWVVGEHRISTLARAVEEQLEGDGPAPDLEELVVLLEAFAP
jgi:HPt (histidine-containing phosphotransfer) domain-containing protein